MTFAADSAYDDVLRFYFADTPTIGQEVWERYTEYVEPWLQSNPTFATFLESVIEKEGSLQSLSAVTSVPSGTYTTYLTAYFGDRSVDDRLNIWKAFLAYEGYTATPTTTELESTDLQEKFGNFVYKISTIQTAAVKALKEFAAQYNAYGFDRTTLTLDSVTTIPSGFYSEYLKAFFGGRTSVETLDIWRSFLVSMGYPKKDAVTGSTIDTPSDEELDSAVMKAAFKRHVDSIREHELTYAAETSESPQEAASDSILYGLMDSLKNVLNTTEQLINNQANALIIAGKVQQELTTMMSRVPSLTAGSAGTITAPTQASLEDKSWSLTDFLFGYNRINLEEVVEWGIETALQTPGKEISFEQPTGTYFKFLVETSDGVSSKIKVSFKSGTAVDTSQEFALYGTSGRLSHDECYTQAADILKDIFASNASTVAALTGQAGITGRYLAAGSADDTTDASARAEQNSVLQQYIENIRSMRDTAQSQADIMQSTLSVTKEKLNLHTSLWTSILEMIDSVIHSIFQQK